MPVRSLSLSVFKWPERHEIIAAFREWAEKTSVARPELKNAGYFGSYARSEEGVGSDLDVVLLVESSSLERMMRPTRWDLGSLPVPVDVVVFTEPEWHALPLNRMKRETVWIYER